MSTLAVDAITNATGTSAIGITSGGVVTQSNVVAFMAQKGDTTTLGANASAGIAFNRTTLSHSSWNGTTFTTPIAGIYRFFLTGHHQSMSSNGAEIAIYVNGANYVSGYSHNSTGTRQRMVCEAIIPLAVGDTVDFRVLQGDVFAGGSPGSCIMCTGHLLG